MARVTIEGCLKNKEISNKFELVIIAHCRSRCIESGEPTQLSEDDYQQKKSVKSTIIALKEIEMNCIDVNEMKKIAKKSLTTPNDAHAKEEVINKKSDNSEHDFFIV